MTLIRAAGARISFDPNVRKELLGLPEVAEVLREVLERCDLLLPSEADLAHRLQGIDEDAAAQRLLAAGRAIVVLKKGRLGCLPHAPEQRGALPAHLVEEVDPTGAGGSFGGAFVAALCRGIPPEEALRLTNAAGALAVVRRGPMEGNRALPKIEAFLERGGHARAPARHRTAQPRRRGGGISALCSAHPLALEAGMIEALEGAAPLLVEATSNQVVQHGGYSGQTPAALVAAVRALAERVGLPRERLILGGDHLGPNPWRDRPATVAMAEAGTLVSHFVQAGFGKIDLDASMACADDRKPLPDTVIAARAAELAATAERAADGPATLPRYVIGTEVPTPGGASGALDHLAVTTPAAVERTIALHRDAFTARGLERAWERVLAVVVQPGAEFGQDDVHDLVPALADPLAAALDRYPGLIVEAHSTGYQAPTALRSLVERHFAILKAAPRRPSPCARRCSRAARSSGNGCRPNSGPASGRRSTRRCSGIRGTGAGAAAATAPTSRSRGRSVSATVAATTGPSRRSPRPSRGCSPISSAGRHRSRR